MFNKEKNKNEYENKKENKQCIYCNKNVSTCKNIPICSRKNCKNKRK